MQQVFKIFLMMSINIASVSAMEQKRENSANSKVLFSLAILACNSLTKSADFNEKILNQLPLDLIEKVTHDICVYNPKNKQWLEVITQTFKGKSLISNEVLHIAEKILNTLQANEIFKKNIDVLKENIQKEDPNDIWFTKIVDDPSLQVVPTNSGNNEIAIAAYQTIYVVNPMKKEIVDRANCYFNKASIAAIALFSSENIRRIFAMGTNGFLEIKTSDGKGMDAGICYDVPKNIVYFPAVLMKDKDQLAIQFQDATGKGYALLAIAGENNIREWFDNSKMRKIPTNDDICCISFSPEGNFVTHGKKNGYQHWKYRFNQRNCWEIIPVNYEKLEDYCVEQQIVADDEMRAQS